ncbi:hypothetical protein K2173_007873 [Erythroxylum novogranatense]|uniref:Uncharacterized protein n=1 Tax=Erythroxylum novogranatense TaxID=1862640 RepID=A0AAV8T8N2_9ROSI|nr:hypothetical protein K2173_007873 [Erythroxylum novogranatense]
MIFFNLVYGGKSSVEFQPTLGALNTPKERTSPYQNLTPNFRDHESTELREGNAAVLDKEVKKNRTPVCFLNPKHRELALRVLSYFLSTLFTQLGYFSALIAAKVLRTRAVSLSFS